MTSWTAIPDAKPDQGVATPDKLPMLSHWEASYDHVFIALHPLRPAKSSSTGRTGQRQTGQRLTEADVTWRKVAIAVDAPTFAGFAMAILLARYGMKMMDHHRTIPGLSDALIKRIRAYVEDQALSYPADDHLDPVLLPTMAELYRNIDATRVQAWDEWRTICLEAEPATLARSAVSCRPGGHDPCAIADAERRLLFDCSFNSMDHLWMAIALTNKARKAAPPEAYFEGFYAGAATTSGWVNEPGTYPLPNGWTQ